MLIQPTADSPGIFVDKLQVASIVPNLETGPMGSYLVVQLSGAQVVISQEHGERLLAELAAK